MGMPIGDMNGKWAMALKFTLASYPILVGAILAWGIWVTDQIYNLKGFTSAGDRFTLQDAYSLERRIDQRIDALPPSEWKAKIDGTSKELLILREENRKLQLYLSDKLSEFRDEFTSEFLRKNEHPDHN